MINIGRPWKSVISAVVLFAGLVVSGHAHALTVAGSDGHASSQNNLGCFTLLGAQIQNIGTCGAGPQVWNVDLPTGAGSRTVAISGTNAGFLDCFVCQSNSAFTSASCAHVPKFPVSTTSVQSATVSVPNGGMLYASCFLGPSSTLNTLNYNQ